MCIQLPNDESESDDLAGLGKPGRELEVEDGSSSSDEMVSVTVEERGETRKSYKMQTKIWKFDVGTEFSFLRFT